MAWETTANSFGPRKVPVIENVGFQFEHQQQKHPRSGIDRRCVRFDHIEPRHIALKLKERCQKFFAPENEYVECKQGIDSVLE
jgi:hypothetical protein